MAYLFSFGGNRMNVYSEKRDGEERIVFPFGCEPFLFF